MGGQLIVYNYQLSYFAVSSCAGRFLVGVVSVVGGAVVAIGVEVCRGEVFGVSEPDEILPTCLNSKLLFASILSASSLSSFLEKRVTLFEVKVPIFRTDIYHLLWRPSTFAACQSSLRPTRQPTYEL